MEKQPRYRKSRKKYKRNSTPVGRLDITEEHIKIFIALVRYRRLRGDHLVRLLGGDDDKVKRELRTLFDFGYVERAPLPPSL